MRKNSGYQLNQKDIQTTINYLKAEKLPHSPKDAIKFLQDKTAVAHITAHKVVEDEQTGKIKKVRTK